MDHFAAQLVTGKDEREKFILSLIVKKEYQFDSKGVCTPIDKQPEFINKCRYYEANDELLNDDYDLLPYKLFTDVVIKGNAYNPQINSPQFEIAFQVGNHLNSIVVKGNRKLFYDGSKLKFSVPEKVESIPLRYDYAYGGKDTAAIKNIPAPDEEYLKLVPKDFELHANTFYYYPRNPEGKGYVVEPNKQFIEALELPNLEDPKEQLTPENVIVGNPEHWYKMPLPRCTDWMPSSFFPRMAYMGILENFLNSRQQLQEVLRGWSDKSLFFSTVDKQFEFNYRFTNAASLGLQLPYLKREEKVRLVNIHPHVKDFFLTLPKDHPAIWVDGRNNKLLETKTVIHTVIIKPDENLVTILWRGSAAAIRPYSSEELKTMPFKIEWQ